MKLSEDPQTGVVNQAVFWGVNLLQDFKCLHPCKTNVTCDRSKIYIQYDMSGNKYTMGTPYLLILSYNGLKYCMLINGQKKVGHVPERLSRLLFRMTSVWSLFCTVMENVGTVSSRLYPRLILLSSVRYCQNNHNLFTIKLLLLRNVPTSMNNKI